MLRIPFLLFGFLLGTFSVLSAQTETVPSREIAVERPSAYFQGRLERLYKALELKDVQQMIRYERELVQAMRDALSSRAVKEERLYNRLQAVFQQFDGFSFTQAAPGQQDVHLALLEEFLAILQIND